MGHCAAIIAVFLLAMVQLTAAFHACGPVHVCNCEDRKVDCRSQTLHVVPDSIREETTHLMLQHNQIVTIEDGTFLNQTDLIELYVNNNQITAIRSQTFAGLLILNYLNMNHNNISVVEPKSFQHMQELTKLHLAYNRLTTLPSDAFSDFRSPLNKLRYLYLSHNQIATLGQDIFYGLASLSHLDVSYNFIDMIPSSVADLKSLSILDMGHNEIKNLPPGMFSNAKSFDRLDLSYNNITMIQKGAFANMTISYNFALSLKGNPVKQFDKYSFSNIILNDNWRFKFTIMMDFSHMQLERIHDQAFNNILGQRKSCSDCKLLLNDNHLKTLQSTPFEPLVKFNLIPSLNNNPWSCDCRMKEIFRTWPPTYSSSIICHSPPNLKNLKLSSLTPDNLTCSSPTIETCNSPTQPRAEVGESKTLCCYASGFNQPTITWSHPLGPTDIPRYKVSTTKRGYNRVESTLTISCVQASDQGRYTCLASNAAGFDFRSFSFSVIPTKTEALPSTCGTPMNSTHSTVTLIGAVVGSFTGGIVLCTIVCLICYLYKRRPDVENSSSENRRVASRQETWPGTEFDEDEVGYDDVPHEARPYQGLNLNPYQGLFMNTEN